MRTIFVCDVCSKTFMKRSSFVQHERVHSGDRPFECDEPGCGKKFAQAGNLVQHRKSHDFRHLRWRRGDCEKPHRCQYENCLKSFISRSSLATHVRNIHKGNGSKKVKKEGDTDPILSDNNGDGENCDKLESSMSKELVGSSDVSNPHFQQVKDDSHRQDASSRFDGDKKEGLNETYAQYGSFSTSASIPQHHRHQYSQVCSQYGVVSSSSSASSSPSLPSSSESSSFESVGYSHQSLPLSRSAWYYPYAPYPHHRHHYQQGTNSDNSLGENPLMNLIVAAEQMDHKLKTPPFPPGPLLTRNFASELTAKLPFRQQQLDPSPPLPLPPSTVAASLEKKYENYQFGTEQVPFTTSSRASTSSKWLPSNQQLLEEDNEVVVEEDDDGREYRGSIDMVRNVTHNPYVDTKEKKRKLSSSDDHRDDEPFWFDSFNASNPLTQHPFELLSRKPSFLPSAHHQNHNYYLSHNPGKSRYIYERNPTEQSSHFVRTSQGFDPYDDRRFSMSSNAESFHHQVQQQPPQHHHHVHPHNKLHRAPPYQHANEEQLTQFMGHKQQHLPMGTHSR